MIDSRRGRPGRHESDRRERIFTLTLLETGSVHEALTRSRIKPERVGRLLDRPDVRSVLKAAA
jgi:hypothetical protein